MALTHTPSGQVVSVLPLGDRLAQATSSAILKAGQLEVMRVVLPAGKSMREHQTPGEITVQCLEGTVHFQSGGATHLLRAGDLVHLQPRALHARTPHKDPWPRPPLGGGGGRPGRGPRPPDTRAAGCRPLAAMGWPMWPPRACLVLRLWPEAPTPPPRAGRDSGPMPLWRP